MQIIDPSYIVIDKINGEEILKKIEKCGRVCYKSEDRTTDDSYKKFVAGLIKSGHESVLEHVSITVKFIISRAIANEIVRHRLASYSQESTRYCNYKDGIQVVMPEVVVNQYAYIDACQHAEDAYIELLSEGNKPEIARGVLPNDLKTELIMTANLREWRHFFKMRCDYHAHPEMRRITRPLLKYLHALIPVVFDDLAEEFLLD